MQRTSPGPLLEIEKAWKTNLPGLPFAYTFSLDGKFLFAIRRGSKRGKDLYDLAILTILITCLGLLGLIAFTTEQRQKEISIRKIMGAGVGQIVTLITRNFVLLVGLSCLIACPIAWLFMDQWLKFFFLPHRIIAHALPAGGLYHFIHNFNDRHLPHDAGSTDQSVAESAVGWLSEAKATNEKVRVEAGPTKFTKHLHVQKPVNRCPPQLST